MNLFKVYFGMVLLFYQLQARRVDFRKEVGACGKIPTAGKYASLLQNSTTTLAFYQCIPNYGPAIGSSKIECLNGSWSKKPLTCQDVYNCEDEHKPCKNGGKCIEYDPNFSCQCNVGRLEGTQTYFGGLCEEANGAWSNWLSWNNCTSTCNEGIQIRKRTCDNPSPTAKGQMCRGSSFESKYCLMTSCPVGMYEWCEEDFDRCGQLFEKSFCSIKDGAYKCTCLAGVEEELDENGRFITCTDIDECKDNQNTCDLDKSLCINTYGSYECVCKVGYVLHEEKEGCRDLDECVENLSNCDVNAECENFQGSYKCKCKAGYQSTTSNSTAYDGECIETRLLPFGKAVGDSKAVDVSTITDERVTELIELPSGIPFSYQTLNDSVQCRSLYASENGIIVVTRLSKGATNKQLATFRNAVPLSSSSTILSYLQSDHICGVIAPLWTDTSMGDESEVWYQLYDLDNKQMNKDVREKVKDLQIPSNLSIRYVVKITWSQMIPPWPSDQQITTFQSLILTNGLETFVYNFYEPTTSFWRPLFYVPRDFKMYPAFSGYFISLNDNKNLSWWHDLSGTWNEEAASVYKLYNVVFASTNKTGKDFHKLTIQSEEYENSRTVSSEECVKWYQDQPNVPVKSQYLVSTCPPFQDYILGHIAWSKETTKINQVVCYKWNFKDENGGLFECCYDVSEQNSSLIEGLNAISRRVGFYFIDKQKDFKMLNTCCLATKSNYFCHLFARKRPLTSSKLFTSPLTTYGKSGVLLTDVLNRSLLIQGSSYVELLKGINKDKVLFSFIALVKEDHIAALQFDYEDLIEVFASDKNSPLIFINKVDVKDSQSTNSIKIDFKNDSTTLSRKDFYMLVNTDESGNLQFTASIFGEALKDVENLSGILSYNRTCLQYHNWEYKEKLKEVECNLEDDSKHQRLDEKHHPDVNPLIYNFEEEIDEKEKILNKHQQLPFKATEKILIIATKRPDGGYNALINTSNIYGKVEFENDLWEEKSESLQLLSTNLSNLIGTKMRIVNEETKTSKLIFPSIIICNCKNGVCVTDVESIVNSTMGPYPVNGACRCHDDFEGIDCSQLVVGCRDKPCFEDVSCSNQLPAGNGYKCDSCPIYFDGGNGETCYHENPCLMKKGLGEASLCENAACVHLLGGYECQCHEGFVKNLTNQNSCHDEDECSEDDIKGCDEEVEICVNTAGSFECICQQGFVKLVENGSCVDIDECLDNKAGCERRCENTFGSFKCVCEVGYKLNDDSVSCYEYDECDEYANSICQQVCIDVDKGEPFKCGCFPNYYLSNNYKDCILNASFTTHEIQTTSVLTTPQETTTDSTTVFVRETSTKETTKNTFLSSVHSTTYQQTSSPSAASTDTLSTTTSKGTILFSTNFKTTRVSSTSQTSETTILIANTSTSLPMSHNDAIMASLTLLERQKAENVLKMLSKMLRFADPDILEFLAKLFSLSLNSTCEDLYKKFRSSHLNNCQISSDPKLFMILSYLHEHQNSSMLKLEINVPRRAKHIFSNNHLATLGRVFKMLKKVENCQNEISQMCNEAEQHRLEMESRKLQTPSAVETTSLHIIADSSVSLWVVIVICMSTFAFFLFLVSFTRLVCSWTKRREGKINERATQKLGCEWPRVIERWEL